MPTNFLQFDAGLTNALSDGAYSASSTRTGGLVDGIAETALHNKLFCQTSTMVYALGQALSNAGETVADSNAAALVTSIESVFKNPSLATVAETITGTSTTKATTPDSVAALWEKGTDIASGSTLTIPSSGGGYFDITGTTTITIISEATTKTGRSITVQFNGALTLTHNATSLILPTGANITTAAGDVARFVCINSGSNHWRCVAYQRASGRALRGVQAVYTSSQQTITTAGTLTLPHGLGAIPTNVTAWLVCNTGEYGFTAGRYLPYINGGPGTASSYGTTLECDATNVFVQYGNIASVFYVHRLNPTAGNSINLTNTNWRLVITAQLFT